MSTTYTLDLLHARRHILSGDSAGAQGADAVADLAKTAASSMLAAGWEESSDPATMPVHDFRRDRPAGDAYKALWGYDADARTQRSCCGAVCYVVPMPQGPWADGSAAPARIVAHIRGDRYLDQGADVTISAQPTPSPVPLASVGATATVCATAGQVDEHGDPLPPNKRAGVDADVALEAPARAAYYHVYIRLHEYLTVREAWIEGGAMLTGLEIEFAGDYDTADTLAPVYAAPTTAIVPSNGYWSTSPSIVTTHRLSACGAILGVVEFPSRFGTAAASPGAAPEASWDNSEAARRSLVEDMRSPYHSYISRFKTGSQTSTDVYPAHAVNVWGGYCQFLTSGGKGVNPAVTAAAGGAQYIKIGYIMCKLSSSATAKYPVGLGVVMGVPLRQLGAGRRVAAIRPTAAFAGLDYMEVSLVAYLAPRPPQYAAAGGLVGSYDRGLVTGGTRSEMPEWTCATPDLYDLDTLALFTGGAKTLPMQSLASYSGEEYFQDEAPAYSPLALKRVLGRWVVSPGFAAGDRFSFASPVEDDEATVVLCAWPTSLWRGGGAPASESSDATALWPFSGWEFVLE